MLHIFTAIVQITGQPCDILQPGNFLRREIVTVGSYANGPFIHLNSVTGNIDHISETYVII